jgi:hypothetical protein
MSYTKEQDSIVCCIAHADCRTAVGSGASMHLNAAPAGAVACATNLKQPTRTQPMGVFVTREHVRHNKSGIAHRGRTGINHLRELPS